MEPVLESAVIPDPKGWQKQQKPSTEVIVIMKTFWHKCKKIRDVTLSLITDGFSCHIDCL